MTERSISTRCFVAVLVAVTAGLIFRSWLQLELLHEGWNRRFAADLSYLVVPPVLAFLLWPLWRSHKTFLAAQFRLSDLSWTVVSRAVTIGILMRMFSWGHLMASVALGEHRNTDPNAIVGPEFSFHCGSPTQVILGIAIMVMMVPTIEEVINRGVVVSYLRERGALVAVVLSAIIFMVFHPSSSWVFSFLAGVALGYQYWQSNSLWPSLLTHMTVNGLIQIDWYCLSGKWNPVETDIPLLVPGISGLILMTMCVVGVIFLLLGYNRETD